jgi:hypothetical protein
MAQEVILIIIPNVACNGGQTGNQSWNSKEVHVHTYVKRMLLICSKMTDIITLKDLWDIRTLNFARTLFSCGFTLPDSINFWRYINPK